MSEQTHPGALYAALAKAQADMSNVLKDSKNPHFKSSFASLAAVRDVVVPALSKHGIAVIQKPVNGDGGAVGIHTTLGHESGIVDCGTIYTKADVRGGNAAQATGSALTYLRRYALSAIAGVAQEDDDGNASGPGGRSEPPRRQQRNPPPPRGRVLLDGSGQNAYSVADVGAMLAEVFGPASDANAAKAAENFVQRTVNLSIPAMMDKPDARNDVAVQLRRDWQEGA